jgi:hypothetical protein
MTLNSFLLTRVLPQAALQTIWKIDLLHNGKAINVPCKKYDIYQDINPEMLMNCHFFDVTPKMKLM